MEKKQFERHNARIGASRRFYSKVFLLELKRTSHILTVVGDNQEECDKRAEKIMDYLFTNDL